MAAHEGFGNHNHFPNREIMRHQFSRPFVALALVFATALAASAADIYWTNIAGGNWSRAANWNPNVIPGATDMALITASGSYTVTQDVSAVLAGLVLGDGVSALSLTNGSRTLSISDLDWCAAMRCSAWAADRYRVEGRW